MEFLFLINFKNFIKNNHVLTVYFTITTDYEIYGINSVPTREGLKFIT